MRASLGAVFKGEDYTEISPLAQLPGPGLFSKKHLNGPVDWGGRLAAGRAREHSSLAGLGLGAGFSRPIIAPKRNHGTERLAPLRTKLN